MKVTSVESFRVEVPISEEERQKRYYNSSAITRIRTDEGITGYGFEPVDINTVSQLLVGSRIRFRLNNTLKPV